MPKASSPVRLEAELMQAAAIKGERSKRSAAEQIEYWASLGRSIADEINPDKLLAVSTGLAQVKVVPIVASAVDPSAVFEVLERDRQSGRLHGVVFGDVNSSAYSSGTHSEGDSITSSLQELRYQASTAFPGMLEQINPTGSVTVGEFINGQFVASHD